MKIVKSLKIVKIDEEYCNYLRTFDSKVPYNYGKKSLRPFIGVLFKVNNAEYFAPLSSPKPKHITIKNTLDLIKIDEGKLGVINFNNMIPVTSYNYEVFDLDNLPENLNERQRILLLRTQLFWLNRNSGELFNKSRNLYHLYINGLLPNRVKDRCCNFPLLEEKCAEYNKVKIVS